MLIHKHFTTKKKHLKLKRGISPIIAEILLIGLTMLAGAITFGTVLVVYNSKQPIEVSIDSFSDFKLNSYSNSTKYNCFSFVLDNQGQRAVGVRAQDFQLYNATSGKIIPNWSIPRDYELSSLQSYYITVTTQDTNQSNWLSFQGSIRISLIAYGLESSYDTADKSTITSTTTIETSMVSAGPLQLTSNRSIPGISNYAQIQSSKSSNNTIEIFVQNYGHINTSYTLDFIASNTSLGMKIKYLGQTNYLYSEIDANISPAIGNTYTTSTPLILTVTSPSGPNNNYFITVWLKIDSNIQDTMIISCF